MEKTIPIEFIQLIKAIIENVNHKPNALVNAMEQCKQDNREREYLTFDSALCYLTYQNIIQQEDSTLINAIPNLLNRIQSNVTQINALTIA